MGQSRHSNLAPFTSGLPLLADIFRARRHVSKVPKPEVQIEANWRDVSCTRPQHLRRKNGMNSNASHIVCAAAVTFAVTIVSATAQTCDYSFNTPQLISALSQRAYAESQEEDYESAFETMRDVVALYNQQIEGFRRCGDIVAAINTQTAGRSAARLARTYCNSVK